MCSKMTVVEQLQLASLDRLQRALALMMVVAWRVGRFLRLGRTCPGSTR